MTDRPILIADIGGTNARFALLTNETEYFLQAETLNVADFSHARDAIDHYLRSHQVKQLSAICLAVAGPVRNEKVAFSNNHWTIDCDDLRSRYAVNQIQLLNDWEAIAYSLSSLGPDDLLNIGGDWSLLPKGDCTVSAVGPGTGLGICGLIKRQRHLVPVVSEGAHVGFLPESQIQREITAYLHQKFDGRVSREQLLSGAGLSNMHEALCHVHGKISSTLTAANIAETAFANNDPICLETMNLFFEIVGQVAGDVSLDFGAQNGSFIGGGICQRYPEQLNASRFRHGFENKGRHSALLKSTPTWLIIHRNPGLLGASVFAKSMNYD